MYINTRIVQKISSDCAYCRCSAAVTMVRMRAEFVDSVARHGRNLRTFEVFTHRMYVCIYIYMCVCVCVCVSVYVCGG